MKRLMKIYLISLTAALGTGTAATAAAPALPGKISTRIFSEQVGKKVLTPEQAARKRTEQMRKELDLNPKQCKKLYILWYEEEVARYDMLYGFGRIKDDRKEEERYMFRNNGNMGGYYNPMGAPNEKSRNEMMDMLEEITDITSDEYIETREKRLKRILKAENYRKWRKLHPLEIELMPEPVFRHFD